jgi:hypothetical protein
VHDDQGRELVGFGCARAIMANTSDPLIETAFHDDGDREMLPRGDVASLARARGIRSLCPWGLEPHVSEGGLEHGNRGDFPGSGKSCD